MAAREEYQRRRETLKRAVARGLPCSEFLDQTHFDEEEALQKLHHNLGYQSTNDINEAIDCVIAKFKGLGSGDLELDHEDYYKTVLQLLFTVLSDRTEEKESVPPSKRRSY